MRADQSDKPASLPCFCGHDCARCLTYLAARTGDDSLRKQSQRFYREEFGVDLPLEAFSCEGGRSDRVFALCRECPFAACCRRRGIDSCGDCPDGPCEEYLAYRQRYVNRCNQLARDP